ncbi:arsenite-resistance protein 2 domain-containing protein [Ditylenchus destructor]|uniref:Serrate RNA effector molecule homolog n=1 Tax=Ditylenchus destructor TaxID=166010 RepID=A0AAD4N9Z5_9BILA|nr:arsenite-resistance protein 2 domain-containing protein [Ditylenchus destructor]
MPESGEEDFDQQRRNRDKFVREREYGDRTRGRDFAMDRRDYSNGTGMKRNTIRREDEPVVKRNRFDSASDSFDPQFIRKEETTIPVMLTFKKFLATQDDSLTDEEAIEKYKEYKLEFKRQEYEKYFQQHRDEEWFRLKYHPVDSGTIKEEQKAFVQKRLDIFTSFLENVVIKLEDGPDEALEALNDEEIEDESITDLKKMQQQKSDAPNGSNGDVKTEVKTETDAAVSSQDAEGSELCKQHPGFLRIGLTDPLQESKFQRRGWVTFRRDVNVKEIFWGLKNAKIAGADLGAIVNRDLKRRIRFVNGVTLHRTVAQNDIKHAAKLIVLYDHKAKLHLDPEAPYGPIEDLDSAIVQSKNPVLKGIVDYLVEETSAEEEELLGMNGNAETDAKIPLEIDTDQLKVLDKLVLYLRIVHSVDFYNHGEYPNEDTMPNRIGIIHVRGFPPKEDQFEKSENGTVMIPKSFIDVSFAFLPSLDSYMLYRTSLLVSTTDLIQHYSKIPYILQKSSRNLATRMPKKLSKTLLQQIVLNWRKTNGCAHSQHLVSKHQEKLDEVKDEALYFNNYLSDPCRPQNPEPKAVPQSQPQTSSTISSTDERRPQQDFDRNGIKLGCTN